MTGKRVPVLPSYAGCCSNQNFFKQFIESVFGITLDGFENNKFCSLRDHYGRPRGMLDVVRKALFTITSI